MNSKLYLFGESADCATGLVGCSDAPAARRSAVDDVAPQPLEPQDARLVRLVLSRLLWAAGPAAVGLERARLDDGSA